MTSGTRIVLVLLGLGVLVALFIYLGDQYIVHHRARFAPPGVKQGDCRTCPRPVRAGQRGPGANSPAGLEAVTPAPPRGLQMQSTVFRAAAAG